MSLKSKRFVFLLSGAVAFIGISSLILSAFFGAAEEDPPEYTAALALFDGRHFSEAREAFARYKSLYPTASGVADADWYIARSYFEEGNYETFREAVSSYGAAYSTNEHNEFLLFHVALIPYRTEQWSDAADGFANYINTYPKSEFRTAAELNRARSLFNAARYDEFIEAADSYAEAHPQDPEVVFLKHHEMLTEYNRSNWDAALARVTEFLARFPSSEFALTEELHWGICTLNKGEALIALDDPESGLPLVQAGKEALQAYRAHVLSALGNPELPQGIRDRFEIEYLDAFRHEHDFEGLAAAARAYALQHQEELLKWVEGTFYQGMALCQLETPDFTNAGAALDLIFQVDYSEVDLEGMLGLTLTKAAFWRVWAAYMLKDFDTAADYIHYVTESLPESHAKDEILARYGGT